MKNLHKINNQNDEDYLQIMNLKKEDKYFPVVTVSQASYVVCKIEANSKIKVVSTAGLATCYAFFAQYQSWAFVAHLDATTTKEFFLSGIKAFIEAIDSADDILKDIVVYGVSGYLNDRSDSVTLSLLKNSGSLSETSDDTQFHEFANVLIENKINFVDAGYVKSGNDVVGVHLKGIFVTTMSADCKNKHYGKCYFSRGYNTKFLEHQDRLISSDTALSLLTDNNEDYMQRCYPGYIFDEEKKMIERKK